MLLEGRATATVTGGRWPSAITNRVTSSVVDGRAGEQRAGSRDSRARSTRSDNSRTPGARRSTSIRKEGRPTVKKSPTAVALADTDTLVSKEKGCAMATSGRPSGGRRRRPRCPAGRLGGQREVVHGQPEAALEDVADVREVGVRLGVGRSRAPGAAGDREQDQADTRETGESLTSHRSSMRGVPQPRRSRIPGGRRVALSHSEGDAYAEDQVE
jgi:hypothetical protein